MNYLKTSFIAALLVLVSAALFAQEGVKPVTILTVEQLPKAENYLPGPPALGDPLFFNDMIRYQEGKALRETERGAQAVEDATVSIAYYLKRFGAVMQREMTEESYPVLSQYIVTTFQNVRSSIQTAKNTYARVRPYEQFNEHTSIPEDEGEHDWTSYPSGHSVRAWSIALALINIDPAHQDEIMKVGYELCRSRVIIGYHYQSDIEAAMLAASVAYSRLAAEPVFQEMQRAAKAEFENAATQN